ncbi:SpoIIE family protein phosphatase [Methylomarinum sp. Ch1-1]|uniref:SpoIIE family protein phosphatase n=1 Tax=Methylomarinum roseum TaxID=3067653 RepID=A0AAU7NPY3_9GAMM|nr:SpoIIE family protein phosphatase [Methylomarinum sp. Ch1-1]MDP4521056.1 SpoIIE family protein phosphatase [Methylomarinum sp. Ch1-1]
MTENTHFALKILITEDNTETLSLLTHFLQEQGHSLLLAKNSDETLDLFVREYPDLVLADINIPGIDSLEIIAQIRKAQTGKWTPIIILSASNQENDVIKGLQAGADDYMTRPINLNILNAKIQSMERFVALQVNNQQSTLSLSQANEELKKEQQLAKRLLDKMLNMGDLNWPGLSYWLCPSTHFSGDLIAASRSEGGKIYLMLADATGHGLAAALPTLIIARTFHAMSAKGYSLASIVTEINRSAKNDLPTGYFVATALFVIDFNHQTIEYWNGGLPDALLLDNDGNIMHTLSSEHLAIGILAAEQFDSVTRLLPWSKPCELVAYSDGLTESCSPDDEFFGEHRLIDILQKSPPKQRIQNVKKAVLEHIQTSSGQDDISLLSIDCGLIKQQSDE